MHETSQKCDDSQAGFGFMTIIFSSKIPNFHLQRTSEMKWHNESINMSCSCVVRFDWVMTQKKNMSHKLWKVGAKFLSCFLIFIYPGSETLEIKYWFCKSVLGRDGKHVFPWKFNASMVGTCKLETQTEESCQCFSPCLEKAALTTEWLFWGYTAKLSHY